MTTLPDFVPLNSSWRSVFRRGILPHLSRAALLTLKTALEIDDKRLIQNSTTFPPPSEPFLEMPIERACPIGFSLWQSLGLKTVGGVEEAFFQLCLKSDEAIGEIGATRHLLNHIDSHDRQRVWSELLIEVNRALEIQAA
jgi:hypothetical protein